MDSFFVFVRSFTELIKITDITKAKEHITDILIVANSQTEGFSDDGSPTNCEISKKRIEQKIRGIVLPIEYFELDKNDESDLRYIHEQEYLLSLYESDEKTMLSVWLLDIENEVKVTLEDGDNGDRDNIMLNHEFSQHFLRLCKLLPLWCGISCQIFGTTAVTSSSANVESYFKDVKHTLKNVIPARADVFLQHHMDGINDLIITVSQKYAKLIDINVDKRSKRSDNRKYNFEPIRYEDDSDFDARELFNRSLDDGSGEEDTRESDKERNELSMRCRYNG